MRLDALDRQIIARWSPMPAPRTRRSARWCRCRTGGEATGGPAARGRGDPGLHRGGRPGGGRWSTEAFVELFCAAAPRRARSRGHRPAAPRWSRRTRSRARRTRWCTCAPPTSDTWSRRWSGCGRNRSSPPPAARSCCPAWCRPREPICRRYREPGMTLYRRWAVRRPAFLRYRRGRRWCRCGPAGTWAAGLHRRHGGRRGPATSPGGRAATGPYRTRCDGGSFRSRRRRRRRGGPPGRLPLAHGPWGNSADGPRSGDLPDRIALGTAPHRRRNRRWRGAGGTDQALKRPPRPRYASRRETRRAAGHSGTNVHEAGVDEPDLIKTDGRRIVVIVNGVCCGWSTPPAGGCRPAGSR